ncbi:hypothetical protein [Mucilaginibacter celer]|uniref:Uncharacterized protein n=1 Tax=Mucilaginibacter celer TaxID=2305508 RepID=A0A494VVC0_9SPHI|nr:hypothetical protein [Mucilaginibacter celer]AYL94942.1 hypothetical protein HYN43_006365 [Mucilaginibacter celer]
MKIIRKDQQEGIFIPLDEWEHVIGSVKANTELHQLLSQQPLRSIFDLSPAEITEKLKPAAIELTQQALQNNLYTSHRLDTRERQFLHRYSDGRIELIEIDEVTGSEILIRSYQ